MTTGCCCSASRSLIFLPLVSVSSVRVSLAVITAQRTDAMGLVFMFSNRHRSVCYRVMEKPQPSGGTTVVTMIRKLDQQRHELKALRYLLEFFPQSMQNRQGLPSREDFQMPENQLIYDALLAAKTKEEATQAIAALELEETEVESFLRSGRAVLPHLPTSSERTGTGVPRGDNENRCSARVSTKEKGEIEMKFFVFSGALALAVHILGISRTCPGQERLVGRCADGHTQRRRQQRSRNSKTAATSQRRTGSAQPHQGCSGHPRFSVPCRWQV